MEWYQQEKVRKLWKIPPGTPLFESYFVLENFPGIKESRNDSQPSRQSKYKFSAQMEYPLRVELLPVQELLLSMQYYRRYFNDTSIEIMLKDFYSLILKIVKNPQQKVKKLKK
jgi:hypothetical protein